MGFSEALNDSFVPPGTSSARRRQGAQALLVTAFLLAVLAVVANDVPWPLVAIMLVVVLVASAAGTAWRISRLR